jgi:hypothetical protein
MNNNESIKDILSKLDPKSPLETIGISKEVAKELESDALSIAVKGLYRAFQLQYHPDRQASVSSSRLLEIQSAYDSLSDDSIDTLRSSYLKQKRGTKISNEDKLKSLSEELTRSFEISKDKSMSYIEGLFLSDSVLNIENAVIAVKPLETDKRTSHNIITIEEGKIYSQKFQNVMGDDDLPDEIKGRLTDKTTHFCMVKNGSVRISGLDIKETQALEGVLDDGYYIIYGHRGQSMRSLRAVHRKKEEVNMELVGSIDASNLADTNQDIVKLDKKELGAKESAAPGSSSYGGILIYDGWNQGIVGKSDKFRLVPRIVNDKILALRTKDNLLALGNIEYQIVDFK